MNKHYTFIGVAIASIGIITILVSRSLDWQPKYTLSAVKRALITEGIATNGIVKAGQNLTLSFQTNGTIMNVPVSVGTTVHRGQILAQLNSQDATAAVAVAQANYQKVLSGATSQQIDVSKAAVASAQTLLDNAKLNFTAVQAQQDTAVTNANSTLYNSAIVALPINASMTTTAPLVSGMYSGTNPTTFTINISESGAGARFQISGTHIFFGEAKSTPSALGDSGLSIQFPTYPTAADSWTVSIPNVNSPIYVANLNAYQTALKNRDTQVALAQSQINNAQNVLEQTQAGLELQQAAARPEDVAVAQAQLALAQSTYSKTFIAAPIDGVVSVVNAKIGQTVAPGVPQIGIVSNGKYQVEINVSETDLGKIKVGDNAQVSLDAYGKDVLFEASVASIDPAATIVNNSSAYKVTLSFANEDGRIKDGMSANAIISDQQHENALVIPATALIKKNGSTFVLKQNGKSVMAETEVGVGLYGLDGSVEIIQGLVEGDLVASFGK